MHAHTETPPLYQASVPVFDRYLGHLAHLMDKGEVHAQERGDNHAKWLQARLATDMLPLATQIAVAAQFSLRAACPLAEQAVPPFGDLDDNAKALRARIARTRRTLKTLAPEAFVGAEQRTVTDQAGQALVQLPGDVFLHQYALPNFFFHLTCVYALLRADGVPLSKADFDGWHDYR